MAHSETSAGPDLSQGLEVAIIPDGGMIGGHVGDDPVLLARVDGELVAVGGACTHYGGPLKDGLKVGATVRCPWHHACFDLRTGVALEAPALASLDRWKVEEADGRAFVKEKLAPADKPARPGGSHPGSIVIVGGGAAGFAAAQRLRDLGYGGRLTLLSADATAPYDRPNLSKDYLAGEADPAWMPLKDEAFYRENRIDLRLSTRVMAIDPNTKTLSLQGGETLGFDILLLATGAEPNRPKTPGFERPNVFVLRSQADCDALIGAVGDARNVVVIGASFIALEAAAALRARGLEVSVVAPEAVPFAGKLGPEVGRFIQTLHESHGVKFHLGRTVGAFDGAILTLDDGAPLGADVVVLGVGVRPRVDLAEAAGLTVDNGVVVDARFRASAPGVFAAGDIARFADPASGAPIRIEHWVAAERQGQIAAANILGADVVMDEPAFFWSAHYGISLRYVGHADTWDRIEVDGDLAGLDATIRYFKEEAVIAVATVGRDHEALRIGQTMREANARRLATGR